MRKSILLTVLLLALPLHAVEILAPNGDQNAFRQFNTDCSTNCDSTDCHLLADEDPLSVDSARVTTGGVTSGGAVFTFPTPASAPSTDVDAQVMTVALTKCRDVANSCVEDTGGGSLFGPTVSWAIYCGDWQFGNLIDFYRDGDTGGIPVLTPFNAPWVWKFPWTFNTTDCVADGSDVTLVMSLGIGGSGADWRAACVDAVEWISNPDNRGRGVINTSKANEQ